MIETGLQNKTVIVTGAASGIGRATARRFAQEGARVAGWDVKADVGDEFVADMTAAGGEALYRQVNVTDSGAVEEAVAEVISRWQQIDVLVNNAGILRDAQLVRVKDGEIAGLIGEELFDSVINVNLRGVFTCTRAIAPRMVAQKSGVILNASSVVGLYGNFGQTAYVASKSGVIGMTKVWARELGRFNIRVNAVAPGFIATEMVATMPPKVLDSMRQHTPLGRLGQPEEIANAYVWLASSGASFVSGTVLSVDGGVVTGT